MFDVGLCALCKTTPMFGGFSGGGCGGRGEKGAGLQWHLEHAAHPCSFSPEQWAQAGTQEIT